MNAARTFLAFAALLVGGCSTERYEGGFETSDLSARVLTPSGIPAVGARVWLVHGEGLSAPAKVLDSARTDSTGLATFTVIRSIDRSTLGLDGQLDDWLAIAPKSLLYSDSSHLTLAATQSVSIRAESNGDIPRLFVPGSHFLSSKDPNGKAVLVLPKGRWTIAKSLPSGTSFFSTVFVDSMPVVLDTVKSTDTSHQAPLASGPDIALDSFLVDGTREYHDSLAPAWHWTALRTLQGVPSADSTMVTEDSGWTRLEAKPFTLPLDTLQRQGTAAIVSPALPTVGTLAMRMRYTDDPANDTILMRRFEFADSFGNGANVELLGSGRFRDSLGVFAIGNAVDSTSSSTDTTRMLNAEIWYFSWSGQSLVIRTPDGIVGAVRIPGGFYGAPQLKVMVSARYPNSHATLHVTSIRLYTPK